MNNFQPRWEGLDDETGICAVTVKVSKLPKLSKKSRLQAVAGREHIQNIFRHILAFWRTVEW